MRDARRHQAAFTLLEVTLSLAVAMVALGAVCAAGAAGARLLREAFCTSELALRSRELRDKLLFHVEPPQETVCAAGLLAATNLVARAGTGQGPILVPSLTWAFAPQATTVHLPGETGVDAPAWLRPGTLPFEVRMDPAVSNVVTVTLAVQADVGGRLFRREERIEIPVGR